MSKYIDEEKLLAEIERLTNQKKNQLKRFSAEDYTCSVAASISCELYGNEEVLSIIKSLQQEQPEVDIEKEYAEFVDADPVYSKLINGVVGRAIARHFAEWGAIHLNARKEGQK